MKLPAVAIAALFAGGIVLGGGSRIVFLAPSPLFLACCFVTAGILAAAGFAFIQCDRLLPAAAASALCWIVLGVLGAAIAEQPRSANHVLRLLDEGKLDLKTPLRWHGRLRDEPAKLPWGYVYELELAGVDFARERVFVTGGLRLALNLRPGESAPRELHAGDEVAVIAQARLPQTFRDDGAFDRRSYLAQQNIDLVANLRAPELVETASIAVSSLEGRLARLRRRLREKSDLLFPNAPQVAGVLRAIVLGDRSFIDSDEAKDFQKTGVFHILVVAGLHVGAIALALFWLGRKLRFGRLPTALFTLAVLLAYVAVVEQRPPVLRAALMTTIVVSGGLLFRRLDLLNSAALTALILLVARPMALLDSSFELTFLAIGCIAALAMPWLERTVQPYARALRGWRDVTKDTSHTASATQFRIDLRSLTPWLSSRLPRWMGKPVEDTLVAGLAISFRIWELFVLTIILQIGMLPLMARDFHRITLAAPIVNLIAVPLTGFVVPLGFLALVCSFLFPAVGKLLAVFLQYATLSLLHIVHWFAHLHGWGYRVPGPPLWVTASFFAVAIILAGAMRRSAPSRWITWSLFSVLLGCTLLIATYPFGAHWSPGKLEVTILDVGQGDSLFVVSPRGKTMLVDGGGAPGGFSGHDQYHGADPGEEAVSPYLWSRGFKKIDIVALTHAHQDHIGGLPAVLENFQVGRLWIGREVGSAALVNLERTARESGISIEHEWRGKTFSWDGVDGGFLWPEDTSGEIGVAAQNNDSLVLQLRYKGTALLLPGDAERQAESKILEDNSPEALQADVLKVGHHGSKNSTTREFLAAVRPRVAVISSGENNHYGHPSPELLERFEAADVRVLRTDQNGAVHILTDGAHLDISCFVACPEPAKVSASRQVEAPEQKQSGKE
jgi:competence protein ComEC